MPTQSETYPLRIDKKLMKRARKLAQIESRTVASVIRQALEALLQKKGQ